MNINVLIAPDFAPEHFAGWHMLNTLMQRKTGLALRLLTPASASEQAQLITDGKADIIYANPFDAASMVRDSGYVALVRPINKVNEMVIAAHAESPVASFRELKPGSKVALTDNKDVKLIGLRLLEPADLTEADINWQVVESYQATVVSESADALVVDVRAAETGWLRQLALRSGGSVQVLAPAEIAAGIAAEAAAALRRYL